MVGNRFIAPLIGVADLWPVGCFKLVKRLCCLVEVLARSCVKLAYLRTLDHSIKAELTNVFEQHQFFTVVCVNKLVTFIEPMSTTGLWCLFEQVGSPLGNEFYQLLVRREIVPGNVSSSYPRPRTAGKTKSIFVLCLPLRAALAQFLQLVPNVTENCRPEDAGS